MLHKYPGCFFLLGIFAALFLWEASVPYLSSARISYPSVSEEASYIALPFFHNSSPNTARFNVKASLYYLPSQTGVLWIRPDDCVDKILINNNPIDDSIITDQPHCSDTSVTTIVHVDVTPYLHPGQNDVEIQFIDKGGQYGLDAGINHTALTIALTVCILGLALYPLYRFLAARSLPSSQEGLVHITPMQKLGLAVTVLLVSLLYLYPITSTHQWFFSHARLDYPYGMEMFRESVSHGIWYPRWLPNLEGGYGYPSFLFIAPGFYFLTLPFTYLFPNVIGSFYAALLVMLGVGGFGAYRLARLWCPPLASIACMAFFYTSPYLAVNLFARGDMTEFSAMMLCPWMVFYFIRLADGIKKHDLPVSTLLGFTGMVFCILVMHPLVFIYCAFPGCAMLIGKWVEGGYNPKLPAIAATCVLLALTLSCPYWLTAIQMKAFIHQGGVFVVATASSISQIFDDGLFNPGMVHVALALLGFLCSRRNVFLRYVFFSYIFLLFLMTSYSGPIWHLDTPLKYSQFPWRVNSVLATVQLLGIIQLVSWGSERLSVILRPVLQACVWPVVSVLVIGVFMFSLTFPPDSSPQIAFKDPYRIYGPLNYEERKKEWEHKEFIYAGVYREFFPSTANYEGLPNRLIRTIPMVETNHPDITHINMKRDSTPYRIHFAIETRSDNASTEASVLINQMFFPGWQVTVNGHEAPFSATPAAQSDHAAWSIGDRGRLRLDFPPQGNFDIHAWYDGPPGWQWRNMAMVLAAGLLSCILYWQRKVIIRDGKGQ